MSVISRNPFDLLGDSEDSNQLPVQQTVKKVQPTKDTTKPKDTTRAIPGENKRSDYPKRGGISAARVARSGPRDNSNFEAAPREDARVTSARGSSVRGGGRGGSRFGDRKPHNFHKDSEKKDLAGKGSWGEPVEAQTAALGDDADVLAPATPVEEGTEEPEIQTKTLEQYLAERDSSAPVEASNVRQANEGADDSQWKDAVVLKKNDQEDFLMIAKNQKSSPSTNNNKTKPAKSEKQFLEIEQRFSDSGRSSRGGSDRGNTRGSRGGNRGGDRRGGRGGAQKVNVIDERSFPALK